MSQKKLKNQIALLELELKYLREDMGTLIDSPDSPEAAAVKLQWHFAQEIEKSYDTGYFDLPKLLGIYGKLVNPIGTE